MVDLAAINEELLVRFVWGSGLNEDKEICDALEKQHNIEQDQTRSPVFLNEDHFIFG